MSIDRTIVRSVKLIERYIYQLLVTMTKMLVIECKGGEAYGNIITTIFGAKSVILVEHTDEPLIIEKSLTAYTMPTANRIETRTSIAIYPRTI